MAQSATCEPGKVAEKYPTLAGKVLQAGVDPESKPYDFRDSKDFNTIIGSDAELTKAVFDCEGLKYELKPGSWSGLLPAVIAGQIDLMFYLYYSPERAKQVDFVTYMKAGTGAITQAGNPKKIKAFDELCGKTVATGLGTVEEAAVRKQDGTCKAAGKPGIEIMTYPDQASGFRLIQNSRADIMMDDLALLETQVQENPKVFAEAFTIVSGLKIAVATAKDNQPLHEAILHGLQAVQASGKQAEIFKKYGIDPSLVLPAVSLTH